MINGNFRFQAKKVWLTYPQCTLSPDEYKKAIEEAFPNNLLEKYCIAQERHQDGSLHIHALLQFTNKISSRLASVFDVHNFHPHIKKVENASSWKNRLDYCQKDGNFITNCEVPISKRDQIMLELIEVGRLTKDFVKKNPSLLYCNFQNLRQWLHFLNPQEIPVRILPKQRHIWLSGPSNSGKSTRLNMFRQLYLFPAQIPDNNDYGNCGPSTDLLYFDEFKGQVTVQILNRLCDGNTRLNTKGGTTTIAYPMVFICANYTIDECYRNVEQDIRITLYNRFTQYDSSISMPALPTYEL